VQLQNKDGSEEEEEQSEDPAWNGAWDVYLDLVSTQQIYKFVPFELALRRILSKDKNLAFVILQECVLKESTFFLGVAFGFYYIFVLVSGWYSMFIFNLLLVYRLRIGSDVFKSIQNQAVNLGKTLVVSVMTIFVFGAASFFNYRDSVVCESVLQCGSSAIKHSFTAETIQTMFFDGELTLPKWTSDLDLHNVSAYFFVIAFVLMWKFALQDISQGLIVDAYSEIRMNQREREHDALDRCFVCSRDRFLFEMESRGFDHHVKNDHNPFSYLGETTQQSSQYFKR
jgi:inositol 1,4,5-triphosphate receptor type 1